mmetsp:Transcript_12245/g.39176  ORF Transcript_12245/g.39176 Transcript_12245/m.39176 type:complete len:249 (+) Transcript_12245:1189-1935(+)
MIAVVHWVEETLPILVERVVVDAQEALDNRLGHIFANLEPSFILQQGTQLLAPNMFRLTCCCHELAARVGVQRVGWVLHARVLVQLVVRRAVGVHEKVLLPKREHVLKELLEQVIDSVRRERHVDGFLQRVQTMNKLDHVATWAANHCVLGAPVPTGQVMAARITQWEVELVEHQPLRRVLLPAVGGHVWHVGAAFVVHRRHRAFLDLVQADKPTQVVQRLPLVQAVPRLALLDADHVEIAALTSCGP